MVMVGLSKGQTWMDTFYGLRMLKMNRFLLFLAVSYFGMLIVLFSLLGMGVGTETRGGLY